MSSNRCSDVSVLLALVVVGLLAAAAVPAVAVETGQTNVPAEGEVGSEYSASFTITELYRNPGLESWTLTGKTELRQVTWTVAYFDAGGNQVAQQSHDGQSFSQGGITQQQNVLEIRVNVTGTVPPIGNYTYEPPETFLVADLNQTRTGGDTNNIIVAGGHPYTADSKAARQAIQNAESAIVAASNQGVNVDEQRETLDNAISAYENENFPNAIDLANRAESNARKKVKGSQQTQTLLYVVGGILGLAVVGGAVYWYRSQQDSYDKLA